MLGAHPHVVKLYVPPRQQYGPTFQAYGSGDMSRGGYSGKGASQLPHGQQQHQQQGTIYMTGNGGSAAAASDIQQVRSFVGGSVCMLSASGVVFRMSCPWTSVS